MVAKGGAADAKMERLLNLVIALLGTKKYLTKTQITSALPGYEGSAEARDRMFERDKDDLRKIGIEIEVKQLDPLFDDEVGYRIKRDDYQIQIPELSTEEGLLATAALTLVSTLRGEIDFRSTHLKLGSLIPAGPNPMDRVITSLSEAPVIKTPAFGELISAIRESVTVSFDYVRDSDSLRSQRNVEPERLLLRDQEWILQGWDLDRNAPRFFIVENIVGEVTLGEKYVPRDEAPLLKDGTVDEGRHEIEVLAPSDLEALLISEGGVVMANHDSSVRLLFRTFNQERLLRILISLNPTIEVTSPPDSAKAWVVLRKQLHDAI